MEHIYVYSKNFYAGFGLSQSLAARSALNNVQEINDFDFLIKKIEESSTLSTFIIIMDDDENFCCVRLARAFENKINLFKSMNNLIFIQYTKTVPYPLNILNYYGRTYELMQGSSIDDFIVFLSKNNKPLKQNERKKNKINISKYEKSIVDNMFDGLYNFKEMGKLLNVVPGYVYGRRAAIQKKFGFCSTLYTQYFFEKFKVDDIDFMPFINIK